MKKKSSRLWLKEHFNDPYVKQAQSEGHRSRAVYKLSELQERDRLFKPGMVVVDLGSAPGSWAHYVVKQVAPRGRVIAVDILAMDPIPGVEFIHGDFTQNQIRDTLLAQLGDKKADWVLSDMAPNLSGVDSIDQPRSIYLAELAFELALETLAPQGGFLVKVFQGAGFDEFLKTVRTRFNNVMIRKPKASRGRSREVYLLARTKKI